MVCTILKSNSRVLGLLIFFFGFAQFQACGKITFGKPTKLQSSSLEESGAGDSIAYAPVTDDAEDPDDDIGTDPDTVGDDVVTAVATTKAPEGLTGGHFDIDTFTNVGLLNNSGFARAHQHAYDDAHQTTGADFFNLLKRNLVEINEVPSLADKSFKLSVLNAALSPGGYFEVNGVLVKATEFNTKVSSAVFRLGASSAAEKQLNSLKLSFPADAINKGQIHATTPGCAANPNNPNKPYRGGALAIQAVSVPDNVILWESAVYYHDGSCDKDN